MLEFSRREPSSREGTRTLVPICLGLTVILLVLVCEFSPSRHVPLVLRHPEFLLSRTFTSPEGHTLLDRGPHKTALDEKTRGQYAPRPVRGFRDARCETTTVGIVPDLPGSNTWNAPTVGATAGFDVAEANELGELPLPEAPRGVRDNGSADIGSGSGSAFLAGHVNHDSGDLSPWGRLHELEPCAPIFAAGSDGAAHTYRVTDLYVVPQAKLKEDPDLLASTGPPRLHLVTCSGPETAGVTRGIFAYQDNLVVRASLAS